MVRKVFSATFDLNIFIRGRKQNLGMSTVMFIYKDEYNNFEGIQDSTSSSINRRLPTNILSHMKVREF